jgi:hypothetical protein
MARKRRISRRKIRIRAFLRRFAEHEVDTIDRFRAHVRDAAAAQRRSIERRADGLPAEVQEFLADELNELDVILDLADQLAIVALYRVVEINTGRILAHKFGTAVRRNASNIRTLRTFLMRQQGINIARIPHYRAMNELRLLNNAIKHAGRVTAELSNEYPRWRQGQELAQLGAAYERLKGRVPSYIFRFAERVQLRYH